MVAGAAGSSSVGRSSSAATRIEGLFIKFSPGIRNVWKAEMRSLPRFSVSERPRPPQAWTRDSFCHAGNVETLG
jgi:hypothetical protein